MLHPLRHLSHTRVWAWAHSASLFRPSPPDASLAQHKPSCRQHLAHRSLLHHLNYTRTGTGQRLLRASLLQPLTNPEALARRYDCVEELLEQQDMGGNLGQVRPLWRQQCHAAGTKGGAVHARARGERAHTGTSAHALAWCGLHVGTFHWKALVGRG